MKKIFLFAALLGFSAAFASIPENNNFSAWNSAKNTPQQWSILNRKDRPNKVQKINGGIRLNGMIISERFALPKNSPNVKITLKTKSVKKFLKVYLFQYFDKTTPYFQQCGQAYDLKPSGGNTYVTSLRVSMQNQRFAAFAFDGEGAEIESISLEPIVKAEVKLIPGEIPVIYNAKAPRMDGKYHPEDWKNAFVFKNPFRSLAQKINFLDGETISLMSDGKSFFIQLRTPNARSAKYTTHDSNVFLDSGLELVFQALDQPRQLHLVVNFAGAVYDEEMAVGQKFKNWNCANVRTSVCKDGKDTLLTIAVPFASLKIDPNDGWKFNICRNRPEVSEYSAMNQGGYFKNLMNAKLVKDLKSCHVAVMRPAPRTFSFTAKAAGSTMKISEYGGCGYNHNFDVSNGAGAEAKRPEIADGVFALTLAKNGKTYFRTDAQFGKMSVKAPAKETYAQFVYYPIQKKVAVIFHGLSFSQRDSLAKVVCQIGNQKVVLDKFMTAGTVVIAQKPFAIPADGTYKWNLSVIQKNGKVMEQTSGEFTTKKHFEWVGNNLGKDRIIVPPFTKMTVKGNVVGCILRDTKFGSDGFPQSIIAAKKEVLASPIKLYYTDANGKDHPFHGTGFKITSKADDRVEMAASAKAGNLGIKMTAWMEYDGVIYYTMDLSAAKPTDVKKVFLEIPCEQGDFFHIVGPAFRGTKVFFRTGDMKGEGTLWKSSQNPIGNNVFGSFLPSLWLGTFRNGISFFAESSKNWIHSRKSACQELIRRNGKMVLRINFVAKSATLKGNRKIEFGLVATPLKTRPVGADQNFLWTTSFARTIFNKGMMAIDPFITNMMMNRNRKNSYVIYTAGQEYVEGDPEFKAFVTEIDKEYKPSYNPWEVSMHARRNGGMDYADYTSRVVVWNSHRVDFMIWRLDKLLRETDVDGVYEDNSYSSFSGNLLLQDQAFIREDGRVQGMYHFLKQREYLKRAAVLAYKYNKPYPRVVLHNTGAMMPGAFAFADGFMDGEMDITKYYNIFPMEWNDIMLGVDWGLVPGRLTMLRHGQKNQSRALLSVFKLYDMRFWITHEGFDQAFYRKIRNLESNFGTNAPGTEFFGYWMENNPVKFAGKSPLFASCFQRKDGALLIYVSNTTDKTASGTLKFRKDMIVTDALTGKPVKFPITIPMQDFMALKAVPKR